MKKLSIFATIMITGILFSGCTQNQAQTEEQTSKQTNGKLITEEEAAMHSTYKDCWLIIDNKVYDVTTYIESHPGQDSILEGCGIDATELYSHRPMGSGTPHSSTAHSTLEEYYIGELED